MTSATSVFAGKSFGKIVTYEKLFLIVFQGFHLICLKLCTEYLEYLERDMTKNYQNTFQKLCKKVCKL